MNCTNNEAAIASQGAAINAAAARGEFRRRHACFRLILHGAAGQPPGRIGITLARGSASRDGRAVTARSAPTRRRPRLPEYCTGARRVSTIVASCFSSAPTMRAANAAVCASSTITSPPPPSRSASRHARSRAPQPSQLGVEINSFGYDGDAGFILGSPYNLVLFSYAHYVSVNMRLVGASGRVLYQGVFSRDAYQRAASIRGGWCGRAVGAVRAGSAHRSAAR